MDLLTMMRSLNAENTENHTMEAICDELILDPDKEKRTEAAYWQGIHAMSVDEKIRVSRQLGEIYREIVKSGIRRKYPEYDEKKVELALARVLFGDHCFYQAFPDSDVRY